MKILVTGGASGLGASIVKKLAEAEENLIFFTYANSLLVAQETELKFANTKALHCDFTNSGSVDAFIKSLPGLDIDALVNNAICGIHIEHFHKIEPDSFLHSFEQNVLPVLKITQAAIKIFRKKKFGKIINVISSGVVNKPPTGWSEYIANKSYLLSMSKSWANECIRFNITSNSISPSFMLTPLTSDTDERKIEQIQEEHPLKKILTTDEVAESVNFLINASQQINGINLIINAGVDVV